MTQITKLITILAIVLLAGCAGPTIYGKTGTSAEDERKDFADCRYEAAKATGSAPSGSITENTATTIANDLNTGIRQGEIMRMCLESKGYRQQ